MLLANLLWYSKMTSFLAKFRQKSAIVLVKEGKIFFLNFGQWRPPPLRPPWFHAWPYFLELNIQNYPYQEQD